MSSFVKLTGALIAAPMVVMSAAAPVAAQELAGAPPAYAQQGYGQPAFSQQGYAERSYTQSSYAQSSYARSDGRAEATPSEAAPASAPRPERRHGGECYAQVRYPASYAPPPTGPEYVWRQAPAPPGAPGPVWCLTVQPFPNQPVQVAPARLGWIRVLCADEATPERITGLKRRLHARGFYRGAIDGRYDAETTQAVAAFQHEEHIEHRGYLSYETLSALDAPPPRVVYRRRPTTFERGWVSWPGKARYW